MPKAVYYAKVGGCRSYVDITIPEGHIEMVGHSPGPGYIAAADGTWVYKPTTVQTDKKRAEYVAGYYTADEQLRVVLSGTEMDKARLQAVLDKSKMIM